MKDEFKIPSMVVVLEASSPNENSEMTLIEPDIQTTLEAFFRFLKGAGFEPPKGALGIDFYYGEGDEDKPEEVH